METLGNSHRSSDRGGQDLPFQAKSGSEVLPDTNPSSPPHREAPIRREASGIRLND